MLSHIDDDRAWATAMKADRLLNRLSSAQIVYLGDGFDWTVSDHDVVMARRHLTGIRVQAIVLGRAIASIVDAPRAVGCAEVVAIGRG